MTCCKEDLKARIGELEVSLELSRDANRALREDREALVGRIAEAAAHLAEGRPDQAREVLGRRLP